MKISLCKTEQDQLPPLDLFAFLLLMIYPIALITQLKIFYIIGLLTVFIVFLHTLLARKINVCSFLCAKSIYLFFCVVWISYKWALYPKETLIRAAIYMIFPWFFWLVHTLLLSGKRKWLKLALMSLPYLIFCIYIIFWIKYGAVRATSYVMKEEVGSFSNTAPAILLASLPYLFCFLMTDRKRWLLYLGGVTLTILIVFMSGGRAAYLMLLLALSSITILMRRDLISGLSLLTKIVVILFLLACVTVSVLGYKKTIGQVALRFQQTEVPQLEDAPTRGEVGDYGRLLMYYAGLQVIKQHPLTGIGFYGFSKYVEEIFGVSVISHNIVFTVWGELGLPGLLVFFWIVISGFVKLWRARASKELVKSEEFFFYSASFISFGVLLTHALFRPQLTNPLLYVVLAVAFSTAEQTKLNLMTHRAFPLPKSRMPVQRYFLG